MVMRDPPTEGPTRKNKAVLEGLQLVSSAAKRVWQELYVCKKPVSNSSVVFYIVLFLGMPNDWA